jgi:hypothetical protein
METVRQVLLCSIYILSSSVEFVLRISKQGKLITFENCFRISNTFDSADIPGVVDYILDEPQFDLKLPSVAVSIITVETLQAWLDEGRTITVRITSQGKSQLL